MKCFLYGDATVSKAYPKGAEALQALRLFARYGDIDEYDTYRYQPMTPEESPGETEACALMAYICTFRFIQVNYDVLQYMVNNCNIKEVDGEARTPLILASHVVPHAYLAKVLRLLLNTGADAAAVQDQGENVLQRLIRELSSCYLSPLVLNKTEEIVDVIVRLIQSGAKPDLGDGSSWTPFDLALMPASWTVWCQSLCQAKPSIRNLLEHEDAAAKIPTPDFAQIDDALGKPH